MKNKPLALKPLYGGHFAQVEPSNPGIRIKYSGKDIKLSTTAFLNGTFDCDLNISGTSRK
ncbi:MAG: hypothetical protein ACFB0A_04290 [Croceivirga sp.]